MSEEEHKDFFLSEELDVFKDNPIVSCKLKIKSGSKLDRKLIKTFAKRDMFAPYNAGEIPDFKTNMTNLMGVIDFITVFSRNVNKVSFKLS